MGEKVTLVDSSKKNSMEGQEDRYKTVGITLVRTDEGLSSVAVG